MCGRTVEEDLKGDASGHFKRLMISLFAVCIVYIDDIAEVGDVGEASGVVLSVHSHCSLFQGNRCEDYNVDRAAAQADAQALLRAGAWLSTLASAYYETMVLYILTWFR